MDLFDEQNPRPMGFIAWLGWSRRIPTASAYRDYLALGILTKSDFEEAERAVLKHAVGEQLAALVQPCAEERSPIVTVRDQNGRWRCA